MIIIGQRTTCISGHTLRTTHKIIKRIPRNHNSVTLPNFETAIAFSFTDINTNAEATPRHCLKQFNVYLECQGGRVRPVPSWTASERGAVGQELAAT